MNRYVLIGIVATALFIVAGPAQADIASFFDVWPDPEGGSVTVEGPPYPTPPVQVTVSHEKEPGVPAMGMIETEIIGLGLQSAAYGLPARIDAHDSGGGGGGAGVASFFDIFTEVEVPNDYPADSFFDLFVEIGPPEPGMDSPVLIEPPKVMYADSFFDLFVEVDLPGGLEELHLHGAIPVEQPLIFSNVGTDDDCDSFFDIFIELSGYVPPMLELPLVTMTLTGTFVPEPATVGLLMLGAVGMLAISRRRKG